MKNIGMGVQASMEQYFGCRVRRNTGMIAWYTTTTGCHSDMDTVEPRHGHPSLRGRNVVFVMDRGRCSSWNLRFMIKNGFRSESISGPATSPRSISASARCEGP